MGKKSALGIFIILSALIHIGLFSLKILPAPPSSPSNHKQQQEESADLAPSSSQVDFQILPPVIEQQTVAEPPKEDPKKKETPTVTKKKRKSAPATKKEDGLQKKEVDELAERPISDPRRSGPGNICDNWYGGVGIVLNLTTMQIIEIFPDYPAWRAGLRVGDSILGISGNEEIKGEPGTLVELIIQRGEDVAFKKIIKRERICYSGRNPSI
jgi:hypothetical protein